MDITSYLLGKKSSGGGGGGSDLDWTAIGYSGTPQSVVNDYNNAKTIYDNWDSTQIDLTSKFNNTDLTIMPLVNTSNALNMKSMFNNCTVLTSVPLLDTSNVTDFGSLFYMCRYLKTIPQFDTSNVTSMYQMCYYCERLENVPVLNTSKLYGVNSLGGTFSGCNKLTDQSVDNILQMCIGATVYTGAKTLARLGFNSTNYPTSRIQALPHYQDFINAGWTIGY